MTTSKTKALKKGNYTPGSTPAPVNTENGNKPSVNHYERDMRKAAIERSRARRMRSLMKLNIPKEQIEEWFHEEDNRFVLCLVYDSFFVIDGTKKKKVYLRDEKHQVIGVEEQEVDNKLWGVEALTKVCKDNNLILMSTHKTGSTKSGWILSDKENVDKVIEILKDVGRTSVTKPELHIAEMVKKEKKKQKTKKPSNNNKVVAAKAKKERKELKMNRAAMRPYYAALRKGAVCARIKKFNPTLAKKIEDWMKSQMETEEYAKAKEHRVKHRQTSQYERNYDKKVAKQEKRKAQIEARIAAQKVRAEHNAIEREKRAQKAQKPVQTELKMVA